MFQSNSKRKLRVRERPWSMYLVSIFEGNEETRCLVDEVLTENVYADKCVQACLLNLKSTQMNNVEEKNKHELARCTIKHPDGDCISLILLFDMEKRGRASGLILLPSSGLSPIRGPRLFSGCQPNTHAPGISSAGRICTDAGNIRLDIHNLCSRELQQGC